MAEKRGSKSTNLFDLPKFANFDPSKLVVPPALRDYADSAAAGAKRSYEKMKAAAEAIELFESTYETATKGASEYGRKVVETTRTNTNAIFDFAEELLTAKTFADVVALTNSHATEQLESFKAQTEQLKELAQKITNKVVGPLSTGMNKVFNAAS
jgi:phasin